MAKATGHRGDCNLRCISARTLVGWLVGCAEDEIGQPLLERRIVDELLVELGVVERGAEAQRRRRTTAARR